MKRLLKLCVVAVVLVLGVSSCMKHDDVVSMYYQTNSVYILQTETNKFIPQVRLFGERLVSASVNVEGETFDFSDVNGYGVWELTNSSFIPLPELDSVTQGYYTLTAKRDDGKNGNLDIAFYGAVKKIGDISSSLENLSTENTKEINITFTNLVENAKEYYLMIKEPITSSSYAMWIPYKSLDKIKDEVLSEKIDYSNLLVGTYQLAVAAGYGSVRRIDENSKIEIQ